MQTNGWGAGVVDRLARDLKAAFPDMRGFSPRNLKYMRALAQAFPQPEFVQQPVAQLPWSHVVTLLDKLDDPAQRLWYAEKSLEHGWSRSVLTMQIETAAHARTGKAVTNFADRLPPAQSDLARDVLKDPYIFDFLDLTESAQERDIERAPSTSRVSCSNWAQGSLSSGASTGWRSVATSFSSICFSSISSCVAMSLSN